ncbi:MAG: hypothetical protein GC149_01840 [Gammaproteobacteria bacterium]|nr:hypothetical protein [Gammaproteobacteria bacterium]
MSNQERAFPGRFPTLTAFALLLFIAMFTAGCGGGGSGTSGASGSTTTASTAVLKADAGPVCETLLTSAVYTKAPPPLSCNGSSDPYTAYLDGSKSTAPKGQTLSYAWTFVSKPTGSNAALAGANTAKPTFVPDKAGTYTVQLVVSAQGVASARAVALVVTLDDATINPNLSVNPSAPSYHFHGGLSNTCTTCHSGTFTDLLTKPSTHMATTNACQACHSPLGFNITSFVDHNEVVGKCSDCHNGVTAIGKSANHLVTTQECSDCHTTTSFVNLNPDGTFDHSNITEPCSACHNGTVAKGTASDPNPTGHPSISVECNACHTTTTFTTPFPNHADPKVVVPGTCGKAGCHDGSSNANGVQITGENSAPNPHINTGTSQACDLCHNTTSYNMGGIFSHGILGQLPANGINVSCVTCHDGLNATGVPAPTATFTHPNRTDCASCHNTAAFIPAFGQDHTGFDATTTCTGSGCHNGTDATGMPTDSVHNTTTNPEFAAKTSPTTRCGQCHTPPGGSFHTATVDHSAGVFGTLGSSTPTVDCTSCHNGNIPTALGKPSNHITTSANCRDCHSPQAPSFVGGVVDHSTIVSINNGTTPATSTPTCVSCHDGSTATGQSLTHVPMTAANGTDCLVCHGTGYSSFAMTTFDHAAAGITNNCSSCHDGKTHDTTLVITKPTTHVPTSGADCSTCHTSTTNGPGINGTSSSGYATATRFVNTVHPAYSTGCRNCHNSSYDNTIYNAKSHPADSVHATVDANGWECNACHTTTGNFLETNPVNHQDPAIKAQACISCHDGNTPGAMAKGPSHPSTSNQCQGCHQAGGSFTAGFDHTTLDAGGANVGLACTTCHDGTTATGKAQNHVATTRDCLSCHAGHPPTVANFANGTFDHSGPEMTGRQCMDCHDGSILGALGKSAKPDHVVTSADCSACHTTSAFKPATTFDHTGTTSGCQAAGCHAAGTAGVVDVTDDPNPKPHIPIMNGSTEVDCYNCHKNPGGTFANASMNHTVVTFEACQSCHDGNHDGANTAHIATTKSSTHFVTSIAACASCHKSTSAWTVGVSDYTHTGSGFPGTHSTKKVTSCTQCHTNSPANADISTFPLSPYGSTCAACHWQQGQKEHGNPLPSNKYNCGNSGCHRVSSSSF